MPTNRKIGKQLPKSEERSTAPSGNETTNPNDSVVRVEHMLGMVWIETGDGRFFFRRIVGAEDTETLMHRYRNRGTVDENCEIFSAAKGHHQPKRNGKLDHD